MKLSEMNCNEIREYVGTIPENQYEFIMEELIVDTRKSVQNLGQKMHREIDKKRNEVQRVKKMYEMDLSFGEYSHIAGVDEVGRGPLAGPIVAAAVILDLKALERDDIILKINDSKKISSRVREELAEIIKKKALCYHIAVLNNEDIDKKGIAFCNHEVFRMACYNLHIKPQLVLSDGYLIKNFDIENEFLIKGDTKSASIACASIIAKVYRDNLMKEYNKVYPQYGFEHHVGYGTEEHVSAIKKYGSCPIHRKSFLKNIISV